PPPPPTLFPYTTLFRSYNDHPAIARAYMRRRINPTDPPRSLLLLKATAAIPHGGGRRLQPDSVDVRLLEQWIAGGAPMTAGSSADRKSTRLNSSHDQIS